MVRFDGSSRGVDGEEHGAFEAVPLREDLRELRACFFGAVFVVAADEDDVLAFAGAFPAFVRDPKVVGFDANGSNKSCGDRQGDEKRIANHDVPHAGIGLMFGVNKFTF